MTPEEAIRKYCDDGDTSEDVLSALPGPVAATAREAVARGIARDEREVLTAEQRAAMWPHGGG